MRRFPAYLFLLLILSACGGNTSAVTEPAQAVPYQTVTPSTTSTPVPMLTGIILPTPTTITHMIIQGDTLTGIAKRYGVTLEALLAANPGMQAAALPVGTTIIIPPSDVTSIEPTPTPAMLPVQQPRCWSEADGGLWCFALVQNTYADSLENLSAQFTLLDADGKVLESQAAFALSDRLPPGQSVPLAIHFPPGFPANVSVQVDVLSDIRLLPGDVRYLPVEVMNTLVSVDASGRAAEVSGLVILTGSGKANTLWVLATAYDDSGDVVGVRRWESPTALTADSPVSFDFLVSSVGPGIDRVEFLAEARP